MAPDNGWNEYQRHVLAELKRLDSTLNQVQDEVAEIRLHVEVLRQKAVTWGALGGFIVWLTTVLGTTLVQ